VSGLVLAERDGDVCILTLMRPDKLNALSNELERDLADAISSEDVRGSRAVVLAGAGRAFCAGADVAEMRDATPAGILQYYAELGEVYERFASLPQPTVAGIHGYCLGGGFELALAADFRVADRSAIFGLPEVEIGILPSSGGTHRLVRLLGVARAKELILLRSRIEAEEALRLGAITEVVDDGRALERATELATRLAELPPLAVQVAKQAVSLMAESSRETGLAVERLAYGVLSQTDEHRKATEVFGRRKPPES
jgi:enoyl-CoA hydratase/carnithine racemase